MIINLRSKLLQRTITLISIAALVSLALISVSVCQAKDASQQQPSLASKLMPQTKARTSRSLSDMFEKVRSKIFGSRKTSSNVNANTNSQIQPAASINVAQRQPWGDLNSFNQQYNPYSSLSAASSSYQWPTAGTSGNQFMGQQYNPMSGFSQSGSPSSYPSIMGAQPTSGASSMISGLEGQQQSVSSLNPAANLNSASNGGLLSSASHLIAQYLSPSASGSSSQASSGAQQSAQQVGQIQPNSQSQNLLSPQQQQQQSQYNEFASILDSMVAQTGNSPQRQPNMNQYLGPSNSGISGQQGVQSQQGYQQAPTGNLMGSGQMIGDNEMSGSSNIQSYLPAASPQQASQKSSMVGLAEQLAPGAQFNKLISFPFSLTNNDDASKEGRYKLHIPFLNQHVKRSDQQQSSSANQQRQQQQQQQYLNSYYQQLQQQQQYAPATVASQGQQMMAQSSQVVPTIVSPQSSVSQSQSPISGVQNSPIAQSSVANSAVVPPSASSSSSSSASSSSVSSSISSSASNSPSQSSSSSMLSSSQNPSASSSVGAGQTNSRPAWSVADLQSSSSSSKLIPMPSSASSSVDSSSQS